MDFEELSSILTLLRAYFNAVNIVSKAVCFHCLLLRIAMPID